ncbi:MAG: sigma-54-dependent Fis family transcriptional regulator [Phycisphaerae bacterium]|nr:sigma-54-dependent Fis family transcriptional regulator [Phycisphaerae bacterium]
MALFTARDRRTAEALAELTYCNPFRPRRIELERIALGAAYVESSLPWNQQGELIDDHPNVLRLVALARSLAARARDGLVRGNAAADADLALYEDIVVFLAYHDWRERFDFEPNERSRRGAPRRGVARAERGFTECLAEYLAVGRHEFESLRNAGHVLACFYQVSRAFRSIFRCVIGVSRPTSDFRAAIWESIFTRDVRRYRRSLFTMMSDIVTLITGPSGSGKELAARAIGLARYVPLDRATGSFDESDVADSFFALNLSALSPTLIESELFGHKRGTFTGAIADRQGWFETCPDLGTVFLDEIGELEPAIQVKLLRVLQSRSFQRIGESRERHFRGKLVAATNRDLVAAMADGGMREDFYYRLCADMIEAPSLKARIDDDPAELDTLLAFIAGRFLPGDSEALAAEVGRYVREHLGMDYAWPGNVRELEQVVSNVLVRGSYRPVRAVPAPDEADELVGLLRRSEITAEELLSRYCAMTYRRCGSFEETGRLLDLDRRTVRMKLSRPSAS